MRAFPPYAPGCPAAAEDADEIGRTVTDEVVYYYYSNGLAVRYNRRSTCSEHFYMTAEELSQVRAFYAARTAA